MLKTIHPICAAWPRPPLEECVNLANDIRINGLVHPIWLMPDDSIIDGKTRYEACVIAKIEPRYETYAGDDPLGFVLSQNLHRRHLSVKERAEIAAVIANMVVGGKEANSAKGQNCSPVSVEKASKMFGVSPRSVARVRAAKKPPRTNKLEGIATAIKVETGKWPTSKKLAETAGIHKRSADTVLRTVKAVEEALEAPIELRYTKAQDHHVEARIKALSDELKASFAVTVAQRVEEALARRDEEDVATLEQANALIAHRSGRDRPPFTAAEYTSVLLRALHPDTTTPELRIEAFKLVSNKKLLLRDEGRIELRGQRLPRSREEWEAARKAISEARKTKQATA